MCGITGIFNRDQEPIDENILKSMTESIKHRGPDGEGIFIDKNVGFGHRRLAILDLSEAGKQPMTTSDEDVWITYNGEVYNFLDLKKKLEGKYKFKSTTDTEVILYAYKEWGIKSFEMLNGIFAFALWDKETKKGFLVRDGCGIKPTFYYLDNNKLIFGSEIKTILSHPEFHRELNKESLHYFINLRYVPKNLTLFKNIKKLPPGHYLEFDENEIKIKKYWDLDPQEIGCENEEFYIKKTLQLFEESIKKQLMSDVPVSSFLSGGLDTSAIVAFATKHYEGKLKTFCMGFGEENDEFEDARIVADKFDTDHKEFKVKFNIVKDLPKLIKFADQPKRNLYPYFIYKEVAKEAKVVLSGLGGDELFGGYIFRYNYVKKNHNNLNQEIIQTLKNQDLNIQQINEKILDELLKKQTDSNNLDKDWIIQKILTLKYNKDPYKLYTLINSKDEAWTEEYLKEKIYGKEMEEYTKLDVSEIFKPYFITKNQTQNVLYAEFKEKMVNDFLYIDDSMSMANSVEARVPFLDKNLVKFAFTIPTSMKLDPQNNLIGKKIFRKSMKDILPESVFKKKKQGFGTNTFSEYQKELKEMAQQKLSDGFLVKNKFIKKKYIDRVLNHKIQKELEIHYNNIWNLTATEIWQEIYFEK